DFIEMDTSFNCYILILSSNDSKTFLVDIYKDNKNRRYFKSDKAKITLANFKVSHLKKHICNIYSIKKVDQYKVKFWNVNIKAERIENNNISTEDDITHKLEGRKMRDHDLFNVYFKVELADHNTIEMGNIHIIAIIPTIVAPANGKCLPTFYLSNKNLAVTKISSLV
ncbi:19377_t:CDS:1, partial [Funneliformis geosporum]